MKNLLKSGHEGRFLEYPNTGITPASNGFSIWVRPHSMQNVKLKALVPFKISFPYDVRFGTLFPPSCPNEANTLKLEHLNHQMAFWIWGIPHWIKDWTLQAILCFSGCWFSGLRSKIPWIFQMSQILKNRCNFTLRWLLDLGNTYLEQNLKLKTLGYLLFMLFFICCLAAPWQTFGYYWGNSHIHPMLITAFGLWIFGPKMAGRSVGSLHLTGSPVRFDHNAITLPRIAPNFSKIWKYSQYPKQL